MAAHIIRLGGADGKGEGTEDVEYVEVESATTPGLVYRVFVDENRCTCPARGKCWHLVAARFGEVTGDYCPECRAAGTFVSYPKLATCATCGGAGVLA